MYLAGELHVHSGKLESKTQTGNGLMSAITTWAHASQLLSPSFLAGGEGGGGAHEARRWRQHRRRRETWATAG